MPRQHWKTIAGERSLYLSDSQETVRALMTAKTTGGAERSWVMAAEYPMPRMMTGAAGLSAHVAVGIEIRVLTEIS